MEVQLRSSLEIVPLDVVSEIGKRLDIKSITRFGSTTKTYRKCLISNPQNTGLYRTIYFYQYDSNIHINESLKVDWAKLCRMHCYNRLKEPLPDSGSAEFVFTVEYITNKVVYQHNKYSRGDNYRAVAGEYPLQPLYCNGTIGYYEITVTAKEGNGGYVNFGLTENGIMKNDRAIGWHSDHFWLGYHGDDGRVFDSNEHSFSGVGYGPRWLRERSKVTVGCLINFSTNKVAFTVDGECLDPVEITITADLIRRLHPIVAVRENSVVEFNFGGQPFQHDVNEIESADRRCVSH